jgi:hypothetical protein
MFRVLIAATAVYAVGYPGFDGYRPAALDKPLQRFHTEVDLAARDGRRAIATLDDARAMRYLKRYIDTMDAQLRSAE